MRTAHNYIRGDWVEAASAPDLHDSIDPATGELVGQAAPGTAALAEAAVMAARHAFETTGWAGDMRLRFRVLMAMGQALDARKAELADLLVRENGKMLGQALHEIGAAANECSYYAGLARNVFGRTLESAPGNFSFLTREPAGVVSVIVPWNAPVTLLIRSLAPALAAGCTTVIKPAPQTPLINAAIMECIASITELPPGVINSVNENGIEVGTVLASHPEIDAITFTGSSRTGKIVMAKAAPTVKRLSLELGGKSPAVVFADADIDGAVAEIRRCAIVLNGQMCTAISRVLVDRAIEAEFAAKLTAAFASVRLGHGLTPGSELGPLIDAASRDRVMSVIERAEDEAEMLLRGRQGTGELTRGFFVSPTVFRCRDIDSPLIQEEHFAPMVSLEPFDDEADAIRLANGTRFGLAASVYTRDLNRAMRVSRKIRMGSVWLNCHNRQMAEVETGGFRESGIGRLHGPEAMNDFLETKHIYLESEAS